MIDDKWRNVMVVSTADCRCYRLGRVLYVRQRAQFWKFGISLKTSWGAYADSPKFPKIGLFNGLSRNSPKKVHFTRFLETVNRSLVAR